jgi:FAD-dependent urate hydroxylase
MLRSRFGHWMEPIPTVLGALSDDSVNYWPYVRHRVPRSLIRGRVALLGDAAHAMPPTIGQGANQALEDAAAMASAFATASIDHALHLYDRARRRRVAVVTRAALRPPSQDTSRWTTRLSTVSPTWLSTWMLGSFLRATSSVLG